MNASTTGSQRGPPSRAPRQAARKGADSTPGREHLPSASGATSLLKSRRRSRTTAKLPTNEKDVRGSGSDIEGEVEEQFNNSTANALVEVHQARPRGPFWPSTAHQLFYIAKFGQLPPDMSYRPIHPLKSYATPSQFDLSSLTIPLTAKEILTFFPNHVNIPEIQHRLYHSDIKGSFQANFINHQYRLQGLDIVIPMDCRAYLEKARAKLGKEFTTKPTTFTTSHYTFLPGDANGFDNVRIFYPIIDCGFHVHPSNFPMGPDSGPFTKALIEIQLIGNTTLMLSQLDFVIARMGISRKLVDGYTDADFQRRHRVMVKEYQDFLEASARENNIQFDH